MTLIHYEHPEAAEHYDTGPHENCECRVCVLKRRIADLKRQLAERDLEETVLLRKTSELAENFNDGNYEYETSIAVEILRLKAVSAYPRLDAYVQEKVDRAVLAERNRRGKIISCACGQALLESWPDCHMCGRLTANRAKVDRGGKA